MLLVHPTDIDGAPAAASPPRRAWATWAVAGLAASAFVVDRVACWSLEHGGRLIGERAGRAITLAVASSRCYRDADRFQPWQPWTSALIHDGWWQLLAGLAAFLVAGRAVERELGAAALVTAILTLAPISGTAAILLGGDPGIGGVAVGLLALMLCRRPRARVQWGVSYYAVTVVGHVPLFSLALTDVIAGFLAQDAARCLIHHQATPWASWLAAGLAGAALGFGSRRYGPRA